MKNRSKRIIWCFMFAVTAFVLASCEKVSSDEKTLVCTLSISCETLTENEELLPEEKKELIPEDGWIMQPLEVEFSEGESVFDVLKKTCMEQKIHMEYSDVPLYNSAYIEGINNIYEFDAGNLSGWMYSVNDFFPNYGCSGYILQNGDVVEWQYTCDMGEDIGGRNFKAEK